MKKAFVLIFSLMALSVAYSAQVNWSVNGMTLPGFPGTVTESNPYGDIEGALVYLVQGSNVSETLTQITASKTAATTFIDSYTSKTGWGTTLNVEGGVASSLFAQDATAGDYFLIVFSADKKYALASDAKSLLEYDATNGASIAQTFGEEDFGTYAEQWTAVVPEPTVLALLALGVAGLALKRKNA